MDKLLTETLEWIEKENENFDKSYDYVDLVVDKFGEHDLANRLYGEIDDSINWKIVADLYAILIWSTSDNGVALTRTTEEWISECQSERKILIALHLDVYPFIDPNEMITKLQKAASLFPAVSNRCFEMIKSRARLNG